MIEITRLKLVNYKGIKTATGLDEIEINREDSDNQLVVILGLNGSGKTTIMNELTPVPLERLNNRSSSRIIENKTGKKEIDFLVDKKYLYKCNIIMEPKKTTCFINKYDKLNEKDYGELNPNGNVTSYLDVINVELGWTKHYMNVGYLSHMVTNIIGMKPQARNDYISVWLPIISEYLDAYKVTQKKYNTINRQVKMLTNDIGKLSMVDYELQVNNYQNNVEELEKKLDNLNEIITKGSTLLDTLPELTKYDLEKKIKDFKLKIENHNKLIKDLLLTAKEYSIYMGTKGALKLQKDIDSTNTLHITLSERINSLDNNIIQTKNALDEISKEVNSEDIKNLIDIENISLKIDKDIENNNSLHQDLLNEKPELRFVSGTITLANAESYKRLVEDLLELSNSLNLNISGIDIRNINNFDEVINSNIDKLNSYKINIDKHEEEILDITNQIYFLQNIKMDNEILKLRPATCTRECPLVEKLKTYISPQGEINKLKTRLASAIANKSDYTAKEENLRDINEKIKHNVSITDRINHLIYKSRNNLQKFPMLVLEKLSKKDIYKIIPDLPMLKEYANNMIEHISFRDKYNVLYDQKEKIKMNIKLLKNKLKAQDRYNKTIEKYESFIKKRSDTLKDFSEIESKKEKLSKMNDLIDENNKLIKEVNNAADSLEKDKCYLKKLSTQWYYREHLLDIINKNTDIKDIAKDELRVSRSEMDVLKGKISSKKTLIERRDELVNSMNKMEILMKIWSPKEGYPAWEMKDFLDTLAIQTNNDLRVMWGSNLLIEEFLLEANEFSIVINRNGSIIKDASDCSDGEIATLTLAISFAIIEINLGFKKYNLIRMDEVDSVLDQDRRKSFLKIITERLDTLECGNLWVISHNNELDSVPADVVALKGVDTNSSTMFNKNIVFDINDNGGKK